MPPRVRRSTLCAQPSRNGESITAGRSLSDGCWPGDREHDTVEARQGRRADQGRTWLPAHRTLEAERVDDPTTWDRVCF